MGVKIGGALHDPSLVGAVETVAHPIDDPVEWHERDREQRQFPGVEEHRAKREREDERVQQEIQEGVVEEVPDLNGIGHARSYFTDAHGVEERLRQLQQVAPQNRMIDERAKVELLANSVIDKAILELLRATPQTPLELTTDGDTLLAVYATPKGDSLDV